MDPARPTDRDTPGDDRASILRTLRIGVTTNDRRARLIILGSVLALAGTFATAAPVAAECTRLDPWPSFTEAAPSAKRIVVGEVVESYSVDSADNAIEFHVRVDAVLRGEDVAMLDFRGATRSGAPLKICDDSILRVRVGDVLAFAFNAHVASSPDPVLAVAWIRGTPDDFLMPGAETLSLARVRAIAALPSTDTLPIAMTQTPTDLPALPMLAGILSMVMLLVRPRGRLARKLQRRRTRASGPRGVGR